MADGRLVLEGCDQFARMSLVEWHLFDADAKYRIVVRGSMGDFIERVLTREQEEKMGPDLIYAEEPLVKEDYAGVGGLPERVRVVSRYAYSSNDALVGDYRLCTV